MTMLLVFFLLLAIGLYASSHSNTHGIKFAIRESMVQAIAKRYVPALLKEVPEWDLGSYQVPIFESLGILFASSVSQITLDYMTPLRDKISVTFREPNAIQLEMKDVKSKGHFSFEVSLGSYFGKIETSAQLYWDVPAIDCLVDFVIEKQDRGNNLYFPNVRTDKVTLVGELDFDVRFSKVNSELLKSTIKGQFREKVQDVIQSIIQAMIDEYLTSIPNATPLESFKTLGFSPSLLSDPYVKEDTIEIWMKGSFVKVPVTGNTQSHGH